MEVKGTKCYVVLRNNGNIVLAKGALVDIFKGKKTTLYKVKVNDKDMVIDVVWFDFEKAKKQYLSVMQNEIKILSAVQNSYLARFEVVMNAKKYEDLIKDKSQDKEKKRKMPNMKKENKGEKK